MNRLWIALGAYALLAGLVWLTIDDQKIRLVTWLILAMFAIRSLVWDRKLQQERKESDSE
jgi:membrane protein implicated in regulation of membrane protease activity